MPELPPDLLRVHSAQRTQSGLAAERSDDTGGRDNGWVPWCDRCSRYLNPSTVHVDGACPACGHPVDPGKARTVPKDDDVDEKLPIPWHLKLMAGALAVYLGYRFLQMAEWLWHAVA